MPPLRAGADPGRSTSKVPTRSASMKKDRSGTLLLPALECCCAASLDGLAASAASCVAPPPPVASKPTRVDSASATPAEGVKPSAAVSAGADCCTSSRPSDSGWSPDAAPVPNTHDCGVGSAKCAGTESMCAELFRESAVIVGTVAESGPRCRLTRCCGCATTSAGGGAVAAISWPLPDAAETAPSSVCVPSSAKAAPACCPESQPKPRACAG